PVRHSTLRSTPDAALLEVCSACAPHNFVAIATPVNAADIRLLNHLIHVLPVGSGFLAVGPIAKRATGRIVGVVDDIDHFEPVLRAARHMFQVSEEERYTILMAAESDAEAEMMYQHIRLALGSDEIVEFVRARVLPDAPGMIAELLRRLDGGFIVSHVGGLIIPSDGDLTDLLAALQCPLLIIR
ncbi:MAG: hypothetical protein ACK5JT_21890, partial [Hyphomicrobiaceae bacterium]